MMTEANEAEENCKPKSSPIKYKNGSKNAKHKNFFQSPGRTRSSLCCSLNKVTKIADAISRRKKTIVKTGNPAFSNCFVHTKLKPQKSMENEMAM